MGSPQPGGSRRACYHLQFVLLSAFLYLYAISNFLLDPHAIPIESFLHLPDASRRITLYDAQTLALGSPSEFSSGHCRAFDVADALLKGGDVAMAILWYHEGLRRHTDAAGQRQGYARLAQAYRNLNKSDTAALFSRKASEVRSDAEPLYEMAKYYEASGKMDRAADFYSLALRAQVANSTLRVALERIDSELLWPRLFPPAYVSELAEADGVLDSTDVPEETQAQRHWDVVNRARPLLDAGQELFRREGRFQDGDAYYYATPSILPHPERPSEDHLILVRLLNYRIDHEGRYYKDYLPPDDTSGVLRSSSALYQGCQAGQGHQLVIEDGRYERTPYRFMGTEDPKLFRMDTGDIRVIWISWEYAKYVGEGSRMVMGTLNLETHSVQVEHIFPSPFDRFLEKNWVLFQVPGGPLQVVYEWHPLRVGTFDNSSDTSTIVFSDDRVSETPRSFRFIKGSANGVYHRGELWFLIHGTSWHQGPGPVYYHRIAVFEPTTMELKRFTYPFKLESAAAPVEFSLGMTIDAHERVTIAYSVFDGSAVLRRIPLWKVEALMHVVEEKSKI